MRVLCDAGPGNAATACAGRCELLRGRAAESERNEHKKMVPLLPCSMLIIIPGPRSLALAGRESGSGDVVSEYTAR